MNKSPGAPSGAAFLIAQFGAHASRRFGERVEPLGLTPPQAGILRLIAGKAVGSQRALAKILSIQPSRLVLLLDELSRHGLLKRERSPRDRRNHHLALTKKGEHLLQKIGKVAREHEDDLLAALSPQERTALAALLRKAGDQQGLTPKVHPGYRDL